MKQCDHAIWCCRERQARLLPECAALCQVLTALHPDHPRERASASTVLQQLRSIHASVLPHLDEQGRIKNGAQGAVQLLQL